MEKSKVIVTGATGSIGHAAVKSLLDKNFPVIMACRNVKKAASQRDVLIKQFPHSEIDILELDLNSLSSIKSFSENIISHGFKVNKLLNNAGIICRDFSINEDGFETTVAVNYIGPLYLSRLMIPLMEDGFDIVLWWLHDITVGECDLDSVLVESTVCKDPSSEQELLFDDHLFDVLITFGDPVQPLIEGFSVEAVFLVPDFDSEGIVLSQPIFDIHISIS